MHSGVTEWWTPLMREHHTANTFYLTHRVVSKENRTPLVLDEEKAVDEDEDHGEDDQDDDHQAAV